MRWIFCIAFAAAAGCNGASSAPVIRLAVDADRDGVVSTDEKSADALHRNEWSAQFGAVFLANVDDDDGKHAMDATDQIVNGAADELDLARVLIVPWPGAPANASATFAADMASAAQIHLFRHNADGTWTLWHGTETLSGADLKAGVEFGVEAIDFAHPGWDGSTMLSFAVTDAAGKMLGADQARLQVAPLLLQSNLGVANNAFATSFSGDPDSMAFITDVQAAADQAKVPLTVIDGSPPYDDQWTQDIFEIGWAGMPKAGGLQTMYVAVRTPDPTRTAGDYTQNVLLGPDFGWVFKHTEPYNPPGDSGSLDSFGNLDSIPPYKTAQSDYPFGRVLIGSTPQRHMDDALRDFLNAQKVQGPNFYIDTTWLFVGHVDEVLSFAQAPTPRGFKLLIASPTRARQVLTNLVAQNAANGDLAVFAGEQTYDSTGNNLISAQTTVNAMLADANLMTWNQKVQAKIDVIRAALKTEIGLADDEIIDVPVLFEDEGGAQYLAHTPGIVNLLNLNGLVAPPKPHGPEVASKDALEADFESQVAALGLKISWTEDWNLYHIQEGEVHCGTNVTRKVPAHATWWEVQR
ncbi:MAG TPA: protein-arginine deiminase family protein [Polyangia bacterium]|nr:protein-arginine deiminase family protein [Polyangia bacterium]